MVWNVLNGIEPRGHMIIQFAFSHSFSFLLDKHSNPSNSDWGKYFRVLFSFQIWNCTSRIETEPIPFRYLDTGEPKPYGKVRDPYQWHNQTVHQTNREAIKQTMREITWYRAHRHRIRPSNGQAVQTDIHTYSYIVRECQVRLNMSFNLFRMINDEISHIEIRADEGGSFISFDWN